MRVFLPADDRYDCIPAWPEGIEVKRENVPNTRLIFIKIAKTQILTRPFGRREDRFQLKKAHGSFLYWVCSIIYLLDWMGIIRGNNREGSHLSSRLVIKWK
jgi:hypothetical protein